MASIFTQIIDGKLPGRFVWSDEHCVGFLTVHPIRPGHTLVVPRAEVDHWLDLEPALATHLTLAAQSVGRARHPSSGAGNRHTDFLLEPEGDRGIRRDGPVGRWSAVHRHGRTTQTGLVGRWPNG